MFEGSACVSPNRSSQTWWIFLYFFIAKSKDFPVGNSDEDQKSTGWGFGCHHKYRKIKRDSKQTPPWSSLHQPKKPEILVTEKIPKTGGGGGMCCQVGATSCKSPCRLGGRGASAGIRWRRMRYLTRWTAGFVNKCLKGQLWRVNKNGSFNHANLFIVKLGRGWCFFITTRNFKGGFRWIVRKILHCLVPGSDSWPTASARLNRVGAIFRPQQLDDFHIHRISSYIDISWSNYSHTTSSWWNILARYIDLEIELTPERKLAQVVIKSCAQRSLSDLQF